MIYRLISNYTILRLLGKGGMADVYYAENKLKRPAAIKILHPSFSSQPEVLLRFETEAQIMVALDHPNIRRVYDVSEIDGRPCIIMEYLDGYNLSEVLVSKKLTDSQLLELWDQAIAGLQYAHQKGVVHRDIKPSNLFLTTSGQLKILDFGIAKVEEATSHTLTGQSLDTFMYMSPEQVQDPKRVDYRTDIYSLAVTFYHLLTGKPPYDTSTDSTYKIQSKIVRDVLDLNALAFDWRCRLSDCLTKLPEDRRFTFDESFATLIASSTKKVVAVSTTIIKNKKVRKIWRRIMYLFISLTLLGVFVVGEKKIRIRIDQERRESVLNSLRSKYDGVYPSFSDDIILVKHLEKYGFVNESGKEIISLNFDNAGDFSEGLAPVSTNGKWGFIDRNANIVIPYKYEYAQVFSQGLAAVMKDGLYGYIDKSGKVIIDFIFEEAFSFSNGRARIMRETSKDVWINGQNHGRGRWEIGYIDKSGSVVIPIIYRLGLDFSNAKARVTTFKG